MSRYQANFQSDCPITTSGYNNSHQQDTDKSERCCTRNACRLRTKKLVLDCEGDKGNNTPVKTKRSFHTLSRSTLSKILSLLAYKPSEHLNTSHYPPNSQNTLAYWVYQKDSRWLSYQLSFPLVTIITTEILTAGLSRSPRLKSGIHRVPVLGLSGNPQRFYHPCCLHANPLKAHPSF